MTRVVILAGASLLALSLGAAILLGPWAARWPLVAVWLLVGGVFWRVGLKLPELMPPLPPVAARYRPCRRPVLALALGFASLAGATAVRALVGGRSALAWLLYAVAGIGMVAPVVLERSARRDSG